MKILKENRSSELDVKRFYLDGFKLEWICPDCSSKNTRDFGDDYMSYPDINKEMKVHLYCQECYEEYFAKAKMTIDLNLVSDDIFEYK